MIHIKGQIGIIEDPLDLKGKWTFKIQITHVHSMESEEIPAEAWFNSEESAFKAMTAAVEYIKLTTEKFYQQQKIRKELLH